MNFRVRCVFVCMWNVFNSLLCFLLVLNAWLKYFCSPEVYFLPLHMESRVGLDIIKKKEQLYFGSSRAQFRNTPCCCYIDFWPFLFLSLQKIGFLSFLSFLYFFFSAVHLYNPHSSHNSTRSFHSSNEYVGHVCGIQVHIASYFPVTHAYCHQRPNSRVSNFLARYTCCPGLHRSCCLFWFCVIIYCLSVNCAPSRKKGLAYVFLPINAQWILLTAEQWDESRAHV